MSSCMVAIFACVQGVNTRESKSPSKGIYSPWMKTFSHSYHHSLSLLFFLSFHLRARRRRTTHPSPQNHKAFKTTSLLLSPSSKRSVRVLLRRAPEDNGLVRVTSWWTQSKGVVDPSCFTQSSTREVVNVFITSFALDFPSS